ncbi:hypothetical protein CC86DRAFT_463368 [Ophiobolus disseminans]|uniref:Uncharacterized protein n=1 Tax=Ophiobolus disseminans TaxID=1469910 RepID=A0A6A7ADU8_9PLEO|nr:hypothetical protein CC86DRAFT_463368 [Ophiobolus disseminans]
MNLGSLMQSPELESAAHMDPLSRITSSNQISSPLLRLPPEIRNLIYTDMFPRYIGFRVGSGVDWGQGQRRNMRLLLST